MSNKVQSIVIGAGAIGLSIARSLSRRGHEVIVIERNSHIGSEISSRNSEVIHAGIYYPRHSMKAKFCIKGKQMLYQYLDARNIAYNMCGKLIVATNADQHESLMMLKSKAEANGVDDIIILDRMTVQQHYEPHVECVEALYSPRTGVFDSHSFMQHLSQDIIDHHNNIVYECHVSHITPITSPSTSSSSSSNFIVHTSQGDIECDHVINAAGLHATFLTQAIINYPPALLPRAFYAKGNYFRLTEKPLFHRLVYPLPEPGGLGVHATIDLAGHVRFGPDVEWLKPPAISSSPSSSSSSVVSSSRGCDKDASYQFLAPMDMIPYIVDPKRSSAFYAEIRKYWPGLQDDTLAADYSGIRPKLCGPSMKLSLSSCSMMCTDFMIHGPKEHGISGLVTLHGIESPGLTSSLAIAEHVCDLIQD